MKKLPYLLIPIIPIILAGCNAERRFNDYSIKHPDKFKQLAAVLAPCVEVNPKSDTIYRTKIDTLITAGNTVIERRNDTVFVTKQLAGKVITKYQDKIITKTVVDSRVVDACKIQTVAERDRANKAETLLAQKNKAKNTWMYIAIGCMVVIVSGVAIKVYTAFF